MWIREVRVMDMVHSRCAGVDISKKDAKVCVRVAGAGRRTTVQTVTAWGSMTNQILALGDDLVEQRVTCVVMEATSDYWKPFSYRLEDLPGVEVMLVNARHVKNLPGRKTDLADATWLAQLGAHGLVRGWFVPPEPIRHPRDLTRCQDPDRFTEHHAFLARVHLDLIDRHTVAIEQLTARIEVVIEPFQGSVT